MTSYWCTFYILRVIAPALLLSLLLLTACGTEVGQTLPTARPEAVGISTGRLQRITQMTQGYVDEGKIAGIITLVARHGKIVHFEAVGNKGVADTRPLAKNDLFRIYSMSKPITAVAAMQLYEQGKFHLSDPVAKFVPELEHLTLWQEGERAAEDGRAIPIKTAMTMQHLLTHTAGLSYGFDPTDPVDQQYIEADLWAASDLDDFAKKLGQLPLKYEPGQRWHYSVAVDVTGLVVQRLSGQPFDEYLAEHVFQPLGMTDTFFSVPADRQARFLPNHYLDAETGTAQLLTPENISEGRLTRGCAAMCDYREVTLFSGGGGLVSTTLDYWKFTEMLRNGGTFNGARLLSPKTIHYMTQNYLPSITAGGGNGEQPALGGRALQGFGFGLGFGIITDPVAARVMGSAGEYFWGGAAGTVFWIDPKENLIVIGMMQLMRGWPGFRPDLKVASYQALTVTNE